MVQLTCLLSIACFTGRSALVHLFAIIALLALTLCAYRRHNHKTCNAQPHTLLRHIHQPYIFNTLQRT